MSEMVLLGREGLNSLLDILEERASHRALTDLKGLRCENDDFTPYFNALAQLVTAKKKSPPPFSLRLTDQERARLEQEAGGKLLGAYSLAVIEDEQGAPE